MYRCARIQGLDTAEGLLLFGKDHFYMIDGFTLLKTKDIVDIDSIPSEYVGYYLVYAYGLYYNYIIWDHETKYPIV